jgi:hypothetical protein
MRSNEWLDSYFGMPFDEVLSVAGLTPPATPPPPQASPPQATPSALPSPPGSPESYSFFPTKIRREIEHPFFVAGENIRKVMDDPFSSDSLDTYLSVLGTARGIQVGTGAGGAGLPRRIFNPYRSLTGEAELGPAPAGARPYQLGPPPDRREYHEAFRKAVAANDVAGAVNVLRNANRTGTQLPLTPEDLFSSSNPYINREIFRHMMGNAPPPFIGSP